MSLSRREFTSHTALAVAAILSGGRLSRAAESRKPRILLRSSWQVVNIGDIAHTPGVLALLEKHIPEAEVILWSSGDLTPEVEAMEKRRFPQLKVVKGRINAQGNGSTPELDEAVRWCDFLLHGSGPSFVAQADVAAFVQHFQKPFGVYGITYGGTSEAGIDLLNQARFVYFRDSVSLAKAKSDGVSSPVMEFGPDGAFAVDLRDDESADKFLAEHQLEPGNFVCCLPRLRYTPYWLIKSNRKKDEVREARNVEMAEPDHAILRQAIAAVIRETGKKVLLCPEDLTQMQVGKDHLWDKLDPAVRKNVVWREKFWLTDEALSTYLRSAGLFGLEMHSPIMCIGNGVPAIVGRFSEQTSKGFMWRDIGLEDWLFDFDDPARTDIYASTVVSMVKDRENTMKKVDLARTLVQRRQSETMQVLRNLLPRSV